jgi:hypothetical protein
MVRWSGMAVALILALPTEIAFDNGYGAVMHAP